MRSIRRKVVITLLTVLVAYAAAPYLTLYRLASSIRRGDAAALESLVDWDQVREGIKEDVCDTVFDEPAAGAATTTKDADALPPFGFSFVRGIAGSAIDQNVTPAGLVLAASQFQPVAPSGRTLAAPAAASQPSIVWAFFESPAVFDVELLPPPDAGFGRDRIRIRMELGLTGWKVTRAWLPASMLTQSRKRT